MSLETDLFKRMECDRTKMKKFGFVKKENQYLYQTVLATDEMNVEVVIDEKGTVSGKVIDPFSQEEYIAVHLPNQKGSYVSQIRSEYLQVLEQIAKSCFHPVPFVFPQSNRISHLIAEKYHIKVEFHFQKYPHIGAWYHPENRKWFALAQVLDRSTFLMEKGECEVLNLKILEDKIPLLLEKEGIYEAYHMAKKSWVSVMMDETLDDETVMDLVEESYQLTAGGILRHGIKEWIIPANPNYFDLDHAFEQRDEIHWKQTAKMMIGDLVYIYYGAPYSQIRYLCRVTAIDIPADIEGKVRIRKMMKIKKLYYYDHDKISRSVLRKFGVVSVRGPRFIPPELAAEIQTLYPDSIHMTKEKIK